MQTFKIFLWAAVPFFCLVLLFKDRLLGRGGGGEIVLVVGVALILVFLGLFVYRNRKDLNDIAGGTLNDLSGGNRKKLLRVLLRRGTSGRRGERDRIE